MKGKALRKHSLHEKTAASVLLNYYNYNEIGKDEDKPGANFTCTKYTA